MLLTNQNSTKHHQNKFIQKIHRKYENIIGEAHLGASTNRKPGGSKINLIELHNSRTKDESFSLQQKSCFETDISVLNPFLIEISSGLETELFGS